VVRWRLSCWWNFIVFFFVAASRLGYCCCDFISADGARVCAVGLEFSRVVIVAALYFLDGETNCE
jgi:hypothetical protein